MHAMSLRVRRNIFAFKSATCLIYQDCVSVSLVIRHTKRMYPIVLPSVACPPLPYFVILRHKRCYFRGGGEVIKRNICFDFLYNLCLSEILLILRRVQQDIIKNVYTSQVSM